MAKVLDQEFPASVNSALVATHGTPIKCNTEWMRCRNSYAPMNLLTLLLTHYLAPSSLAGLSIPLDARVTMAEVGAWRTAATDLRCGPRKEVFQFSTPSGEFRAKWAEPSATCKTSCNLLVV